MTDLYVVVSDALQRAAVVTYTPSKMPELPWPAYLPAAAEPVRDLAKGRAQMAALALRYPNNVKGW